MSDMDPPLRIVVGPEEGCGRYVTYFRLAPRYGRACQEAKSLMLWFLFFHAGQARPGPGSEAVLDGNHSDIGYENDS
ncbi:MAG TPA: hypothetical protein VJT32_16800, partial [bacterium]|nr:hypothetical protein [bacterium]